MKGIRVYPNAEGWLDDEAMRQPGAYGRATGGMKPMSPANWWQVCTPDGHVGCLSPLIHDVIEHEDGTITVHPSIDMSRRTPGAFHGWLKRGEWTP